MGGRLFDLFALSAAQQRVVLEVEKPAAIQRQPASSAVVQADMQTGSLPWSALYLRRETRHEIICSSPRVRRRVLREFRPEPQGHTTGLCIQIPLDSSSHILRDHVLPLFTDTHITTAASQLSCHPKLGERSVGRPPDLSDAHSLLPIGI